MVKKEEREEKRIPADGKRHGGRQGEEGGG
jgi:hypothetical protein